MNKTILFAAIGRTLLATLVVVGAVEASAQPARDSARRNAPATKTVPPPATKVVAPPPATKQAAVQPPSQVKQQSAPVQQAPTTKTAPTTQTKTPATTPQTKTAPTTQTKQAAPPTAQTKTTPTQAKTTPPTQVKTAAPQTKQPAPQTKAVTPPANQAKTVPPPVQSRTAPAPGGQVRAPAGGALVPVGSRGDTALGAPLVMMREVFEYERDGRRDPFVSLLSTTDLRPTLSDLKLLMTVVDEPGRSVALVNDAYERKQRTLRVGTRLGRMRVASIRSDAVVFTIEEFGMNRRDSLLLRDTTRVRGR